MKRMIFLFFIILFGALSVGVHEYIHKISMDIDDRVEFDQFGYKIDGINTVFYTKANWSTGNEGVMKMYEKEYINRELTAYGLQAVFLFVTLFSVKRWL